MESENKFYYETSDRFEMYDLTELAGPEHIHHIPELLYWYIYTIYGGCDWIKMHYYEYVSRSQTPLLPLKSLDEEAKITPNYVIPANIT